MSQQPTTIRHLRSCGYDLRLWCTGSGSTLVCRQMVSLEIFFLESTLENTNEYIRNFFRLVYRTCFGSTYTEVGNEVEKISYKTPARKGAKGHARS